MVHAMRSPDKRCVLQVAAALGAIVPALGAAGGELSFRVSGPPLAIGEATKSIAWGDVTGDGRPDLIATNQHDLTLLVNTIETENTLGPAIHFGGSAEGGGEPRDVAILDLNGDGANDLLIAQRDAPAAAGALRVQLNLGNGEFAPPQTFGPEFDAWSLRHADVDGDGAVDAIVAYDKLNIPPGHSSSSIAVYRNLGNGHFDSPHHHHIVNSPVTYLVDVAVGDVDGDEWPDLVAVHGNMHLIMLFRNLGDGTFAAGAALEVGNAIPLGIDLADVDQDGDLDLVWMNQMPGGLMVSRNDGHGGFAPASLHPISASSSVSAPFRPAIADFNGDGWPDVAVDGRVLLNQGGAGFASPTPVDIFDENTNINVAPDLDGDGAPDLLFVRFGSTSLATILINESIIAHTPADLDGNGVVNVLDLLALLGEWGPCEPRRGRGGNGSCPADIAPMPGDGVVNVHDLLMLLGDWG